jgi:hypothetical protein
LVRCRCLPDAYTSHFYFKTLNPSS